MKTRRTKNQKKKTKITAAFPRHTIIDLTQELTENIPLYPGPPGLKLENLATLEKNGFFSNKLTMGEHIGTHVDAPAHFVPGPTMEQIPAKDLIAPLVVVDVRKPCAANADYAISPKDVKVKIPPRSVVVFWTGWQDKWHSPKDFVNDLHFPGISRELAEWLVRQNIVGVGVDTLSVDCGSCTTDFPAHTTMHGKNLYHIENLTNLDRVPATGATIFVGAVKLRGGSAAPARVLALVPR